jgi:hypothetical protein
MTVDDAYRSGRHAMGSAAGLAIDAGRVWVRTVAWSTRAWITIGTRLGSAALDPGSATRLVDGVLTRLEPVLGSRERDEEAHPDEHRDERAQRNGAVSERQLRQRGAELLRDSADVTVDDSAHPAYARILEELAPDEARILRLLASEGPQPVVDVHATNLVGVASDRVAAALNMLGAEAGCRHRDRAPAYLNNLERLGLIEFSDKPLDDPIRYQVLEAQPEVLGTIKDTTRAKSVHRTARLTPFGKDFCDVCLPLDTAEMEALTEPGA